MMKRSPMKRGPSKNSRSWERLPFRREYRAKNDRCEVLPLLIAYGLELQMFGGKHCLEGTVFDIHHLFRGGGRQRPDLLSNLITLCRPVHALDDDKNFRTDLRVICMFAKMLKGELDAVEINKAAGAVRPDAQPALVWLEDATPKFYDVDLMRLKLIHRLSTGDQ